MNAILYFLSTAWGKSLIAGGIVFCLVFAFLTWQHYEIQTEARKQYEDLQNNFKAAEYEKREKELKKQQQVISEYAAKIEELQQLHDETLRQIESGEFRDVVHVPVFMPSSDNCAGVQRQDGNGKSGVPKNGNSGDLVCYTGEQLQQKVKESMAIAEECDRLAERYKSLLEICKG